MDDTQKYSALMLDIIYSNALSSDSFSAFSWDSQPNLISIISVHLLESNCIDSTYNTNHNVFILIVALMTNG